MKLAMLPSHVSILLFLLLCNNGNSLGAQSNKTDDGGGGKNNNRINIADEIVKDLGDRYYQVLTIPNTADEFCQYINETCPAIRSYSGVPITNATTKKLHIGIEFIPVKLLDINEIEESLALRIDLRVFWGLPACANWKHAKELGPQASMRLNESLKNGQLPENCYFDKGQMYVPQLLHVNAMGNTYAIETTGNKKISVSNQGVATLINKNRFDSMCSLDFTFFPFDTQECYMEISAFSSDVAIVWTHVFVPPTADLIGQNTIWKLHEKYSEEIQEGPYTNARLTMKLPRRPSYHLLLILAPTIVLMFLQLAAFLLPYDVEERSTYSITVVLAMQVSLSAVHSEIPVTSQPVYLAYYVATCQMIGAAMTMYINVAVRFAVHKIKLAKQLRKIDMFIGCIFAVFILILNAVVFIVLTKNIYI